MKIRQRLSRLEEAIKPPHPINPYRGASDGELIGLARQMLADPQGHPEEFLVICRQAIDNAQMGDISAAAQWRQWSGPGRDIR